MKGKCIKVPRKMGEMIRRNMIETDIIRIDARIKTDGDHILIPLKEGAESFDLPVLKDKFELVEMDIEIFTERPRSYKDIVDIDPTLKKQLPSSFDILGDICIIKLSDDIMPFREEIASSIMKVNKNIEKVAADKGVKGEFRVRDLEIIGGSGGLETTHVENNLRFKLDPSKVYFSPRLATERMRIASMVKEEKVLDMFAGVGPFSLNIARHGSPKGIIGIDINPACHHYFKINISLNGLDDHVESVFGDAVDIVPSLDRLDRVIMNLPHSSLDFLPLALDILGTGGYVHIYSVIDLSSIKDTINKIINIGKNVGKNLEMIGLREVHNYSPDQSVMALDVRVN